MRRIAIVGCRPPGRGDDPRVFAAIRYDLLAFIRRLPAGTVVVSGGAMGVDTLAAMMAQDGGLRVIEHRPNYIEYGRRAPLARNATIVGDCDELHAWPAPWSRGTWHTVRLARSRLGEELVTVHEVG